MIVASNRIQISNSVYEYTRKLDAKMLGKRQEMNAIQITDWGEASEVFDEIASFIAGRDLHTANEAQTRYDVINRMIREVLGWRHGQVSVEERSDDSGKGFIDYLLRCGDITIRSM
jgi:hypothetical protein